MAGRGEAGFVGEWVAIGAENEGRQACGQMTLFTGAALTNPHKVLQPCARCRVASRHLVYHLVQYLVYHLGGGHKP